MLLKDAFERNMLLKEKSQKILKKHHYIKMWASWGIKFSTKVLKKYEKHIGALSIAVK